MNPFVTRWSAVLGFFFCLVAARAEADPAGSGTLENRYASYPPVVQPESGISWPKGQALPIFAPPAETLDAIFVHSLSPDELITFSALQGLINKTKPRIYLLNRRSEEGTYTWAETDTVKLGSRNLYERETKYDLVRKYAGELTGLVLYDPANNAHHRNLAGTVAGLEGALPVTPEVRSQLEESGVQLAVKVDLTGLKHASAVEVYEYLLQNYWSRCNKRVLISAKPLARGDYHHTRDIAAASGAAVVWLDTLIPEERKVLQRFFADMQAGEAVILGWYTTERSGITAASEFGIGTLPADHFMNATVYAGTDHTIRIPPVPRKPELANKVYVAIFISDGDNIQYTQHALRRIWDRSASIRGKVPLNWTIAPGLVDIAPAFLNYYYSTATPKDCFVAGPSGMGYLMPVNTLEDPGAAVGVHLQDQARMDGYAALTERYLQRAGLRVLTIWDDATPMHRASYERHARTLQGATVQNFKDVPSVAGGTQNGRLHFDKLAIPYTGTYEHIHRALRRRLSRWEGDTPLFLSYQVNIWGEMKPPRVVELQEQLSQEFPDKVEFVRADHYFALYNEANGLPYNLCMSNGVTVTSSDASADAEKARDGTRSTAWQSSHAGDRWLTFDLGAEHEIKRFVLAFTESSSRKPAYKLLASQDGQDWTTLDARALSGTTAADVEFSPVRARFVKLSLESGDHEAPGVSELEIYGNK